MKGLDVVQALFSGKLQGADVGAADWSNLNLEGADLSRINLRGCNLTGANLNGCSFAGTNLEGATLPFGLDKNEIYMKAALSKKENTPSEARSESEQTDHSFESNM